LDGVDAFDSVDTVTGDSGLLTLAHEPNRMVHREGKFHLISHVWLGGGLPDHENITPTRGRSTQRQPTAPFATAFNSSLDWTEGLAQSIPSTSKRAYICAFMHLVLFGLFCRLRHLSKLIEAKDELTFRRVLYSGCAADEDLVSKEIGYLRDAGSCSPVQARQIIAFWQSGVCGLHTADQIKDNLRNPSQDVFDWVQRAFNSRAFQIDRDWLNARVFLASYRRKDAHLPKWVATEVKGFGNKHLLCIGHVFSVDWVVPRNADEDLISLGMQEAPSSILTDSIRHVWSEPQISDDAILQPMSLVQHITSAQHFNISEDDMTHLFDSMTAILEPSSQARSVERVVIDSEVLEEDGETEVVSLTQTSQVILPFFSTYFGFFTSLQTLRLR
jgi:hypothetical protein